MCYDVFIREGDTDMSTAEIIRIAKIDGYRFLRSVRGTVYGRKDYRDGSVTFTPEFATLNDLANWMMHG